MCDFDKKQLKAFVEDYFEVMQGLGPDKYVCFNCYHSGSVFEEVTFTCCKHCCFVYVFCEGCKDDRLKWLNPLNAVEYNDNYKFNDKHLIGEHYVQEEVIKINNTELLDLGELESEVPQIHIDNFGSGWIRDLTMEGIEPNPGPPKLGKQVKKVEKKIEKKIVKKIKKKINNNSKGKMVGKGDYKIHAKNWGDLFAQTAGAGITAGINEIFGTGDYQQRFVDKTKAVHNFDKIRTNSLIHAAASSDAPAPGFASNSDGMYLTNREKIMNISPSSAFNITKVSGNPGISAFLPRSGNLWNNFTEYVIDGMIFEFVSTSADYSANVAIGKVIVTPVYDSNSSVFPDSTTQENYQGSLTCKPSQDMWVGVECKLADRPFRSYYVRDGNTSIPTGTSIREYDYLDLYISTEGQPSGSTGIIGELWVTYKIRGFIMKIYTAPSLTSPYIRINSVGAATGVPFNTVLTSTTTTSILPSGWSYSLVIATSTLTVSGLPQGQVIYIDYNIIGGATLSAMASSTTNLSGLSIFNNNSSNGTTVLQANNGSVSSCYTVTSAGPITWIPSCTGGGTHNTDIVLFFPGGNMNNNGSNPLSITIEDKMTLMEEKLMNRIKVYEEKLLELENKEVDAKSVADFVTISPNVLSFEDFCTKCKDDPAFGNKPTYSITQAFANYKLYLDQLKNSS